MCRTPLIFPILKKKKNKHHCKSSHIINLIWFLSYDFWRFFSSVSFELLDWKVVSIENLLKIINFQNNFSLNFEDFEDATFHSKGSEGTEMNNKHHCKSSHIINLSWFKAGWKSSLTTSKSMGNSSPVIGWLRVQPALKIPH